MAFFLLIYDRTAGKLLRQQEYERHQDAMTARFAAEYEFSGRANVEIVALSAGSEEQLRNTHARYFLGLSELAERMA